MGASTQCGDGAETATTDSAQLPLLAVGGLLHPPAIKEIFGGLYPMHCQLEFGYSPQGLLGAESSPSSTPSSISRLRATVPGACNSRQSPLQLSTPNEGGSVEIVGANPTEANATTAALIMISVIIVYVSQSMLRAIIHGNSRTPALYCTLKWSYQ